MTTIASPNSTDQSRPPAVYLGHGAPPLMDDPLWPKQLADWAQALPRPKAILVVSAHWEAAPLMIGATTTVPLVYDFYGFPERYYQVTYPAPGAPRLGERVRRLVSELTPTAQDPGRGLDHGAYVPLLAMYPEADIPVLQMSMPSEEPRVLLEIGRRLAPLRDEGVLIMGSGLRSWRRWQSRQASTKASSCTSEPPASWITRPSADANGPLKPSAARPLMPPVTAGTISSQV